MKATFRRWCWRIFIGLGIALVSAALLAAGLWIYLNPSVSRTNGVVYGHRGQKALALDVVRPAHPNGLGVIVVMSGRWRSTGPGSFQPALAAPILRRGYTVFAVYHISQPEASVQEIKDDLLRAVRFIRHTAHEYGVDPQHLGISGGSSGGHLSLMVATTGGPGDPGASDPVDWESSAVQAVAIFFPPTDLINLGPSTENLHDGGPPKSFKKSFGPGAEDPKIWSKVGRDISPIFQLRTNIPPILIYHGDADTLVPLDQSERFQAAALPLGITLKLVVHRGGKHGWLTMIFDEIAFADWYDHYLKLRNDG